MPVHMICMYIQQTVLAIISSHIKVPSQVCLIDCLVFKQQKTQYESFTLKHHRHYHQLLQRWGSKNHHMVVTSLVRHTLPPFSIPKHLETSLLLTSNIFQNIINPFQIWKQLFQVPFKKYPITYFWF